MEQTIIHIAEVILVLVTIVMGFVMYDVISNWHKVASLYAALRGLKWYVPEFEVSNGKKRFSYHCGLGTLMVETDMLRVTWYDDGKWSGALKIQDIMPVVQWVLCRKIYTTLNTYYRRDRDKFDLMARQHDEILKLIDFEHKHNQQS